MGHANSGTFTYGVPPKGCSSRHACCPVRFRAVTAALQLTRFLYCRMDIASLRKSYEKAELDETASAPQPLQQFQLWFEQALAAQLPEPNAMTLATVGADGRPSTRIVLIKGFDERGIVWYTNYASRKGRELAERPFAALQFHWVELERVVRIEGRVEKTSAAESDAYFATRPLDSRLGAWASPQSEVIASRATLVAAAAKAAAR